MQSRPTHSYCTAKGHLPPRSSPTNLVTPALTGQLSCLDRTQRHTAQLWCAGPPAGPGIFGTGSTAPRQYGVLTSRGERVKHSSHDDRTTGAAFLACPAGWACAAYTPHTECRVNIAENVSARLHSLYTQLASKGPDTEGSSEGPFLDCGYGGRRPTTCRTRASS